MTTDSRHMPGGMRFATRLFNPVSMLLAGTVLLPLYGVLQHRGRRSGKIFRTPVVVVPTSDGFMVPMPWGLKTDWYRNVSAAGECVIRWKGRDYPMVHPEVIDTATATAAFSPMERAGMSRFHIEQYLRLRHRASSTAAVEAAELPNRVA